MYRVQDVPEEDIIAEGNKLFGRFGFEKAGWEARHRDA
jgi:hypothetical protein